jgi:hypothetical protein
MESILVDVKSIFSTCLVVNGIHCPFFWNWNRQYCRWSWSDTMYIAHVEEQSGFTWENNTDIKICNVSDYDMNSFKHWDTETFLEMNTKKVICQMKAKSDYWLLDTGEKIKLVRKFWQNEWYIDNEIVMSSRIPFKSPFKFLRFITLEAKILTYRLVPHLIGVLITTFNSNSTG